MASLAPSLFDAPDARDARVSGQGIVLAGDRVREFKRARWNSARIKFLRFGVPASGVGLAGLYVMTILQTAGWGSTPTLPTIAPILSKEVTMDNPRYEGFSKDGGNYVVTAKTALPDLKNPSVVALNGIVGEMYDARKSRTDLTAAKGLFDSKTNQLDLRDGITVEMQSGLRAQLQTATIMTKEGTLVSNAPVRVEMPTGVITSNKLKLNQKTHDVTFNESVVTHLVPLPKAAGGQDVPPRSTSGFGQSSAPTDVTSDQLEVHDASKQAKFSGRVKATQGLARIETGILDITYEGASAPKSEGAASGMGVPASGAPAPAADPMAAGTKIKRVVAPGAVVLTQGAGDRVTGNSADFDTANEIAVVVGDVVMTSGIDKRATAERVEFAQKPDTIHLTGNVVVNAARNELRGRSLFVDRRKGTTVLTSPAQDGLAKSRIFAKLYQGDGQPGKPAPLKTASTDDASGAGMAVGFTTFKTDPNAPVDIEADKLSVDDTKKHATFTGDVKAAQGDFIIRTKELNATYTGEGGLATVTGAGAASASKADTPKTPAQLTKIEAKGGVVITSKQGQQVTGDTATFDMKANTAVIAGREVIATQDKSVLKGNRLIIDMTTGQSRMVTEMVVGASTSSSTTSAATTTTVTKPGRSSVVLYPGERQKGSIAPLAGSKASLGAPSAPAAPAQKAPPHKPATSSWESAVQPSTAKP